MKVKGLYLSIYICVCVCQWYVLGKIKICNSTSRINPTIILMGCGMNLAWQKMFLWNHP